MKAFFSNSKLLSVPLRRAAYSDRTAWLLAEMSRLSYEEPEVIRESLSAIGFEMVKFFNKTCTQAFLARRESDKMAVLAFRGTQCELKEVYDIIHDLWATLTEASAGGAVHSGFLNAFNAVKDDVKKEIEKLHDHSLYITGHSLGGALAALAVREFENNGFLAAGYSFGAPQVGTKDLDIDARTPVYRIVNMGDIVPALPCGDGIFGWVLRIALRIIARTKNAAKEEKGKIVAFLEQMTTYKHDGVPFYIQSDLSQIRNEADTLRKCVGLNWKQGIRDHAIETYAGNLSAIAESRLANPSMPIAQAPKLAEVSG